MMSPFPNLSQVYPLVNQEKTQRGVDNNSVQAMLTNIESNAFFSRQRNTNKSVQHNKKEGLHCNYCNESVILKKIVSSLLVIHHGILFRINVNRNRNACITMPIKPSMQMMIIILKGYWI